MAETAKAITTLELGADGGFQIAVALKKITSYQDVTLDNASPKGNPISQKKVDLVTDEEVASDEIRKGIFRSKPTKSKRETWGDFVEISKDDLEVIEDATSIDNFVIDHFVPLKDVPTERISDAYFLAPPDGMSAKPLVLLAKALRKTKRAGIFKMVKASRQYLAVVYEKDGGLIVNTLAWSDSFSAVREAAESLDRQDGKVTPAEVNVACELIEALGAEADVIDTFEDDLVPLRADLVERALSGKGLPKRKAKPVQAPVIDDGLEHLLRESIQKVSKSASTKRSPAAV